MRVLIASHDGENYFGGPYEWIKRIGPALGGKGIEVHFLFYSDHDERRSTTFLYMKALGFRCNLLRVHSLSQYSDNTEERITWFIEKCKQVNPDIFIAHNILPALLAGRWIAAMGIPTVGILHSDDKKLDWYEDVFLEPGSAFTPAATVFVSEYLYQTRTKGTSLDRVISCGTTLYPKQSVMDRPKVLYAGKIATEAKQIVKTVEAVQQFLTLTPGAVFTIAGGGPEKQALEDLLKAYSNPYINYIGPVPSHTIQELMAAHNIFVLLSDYEGLPIALMEAMAVGCVPVCLHSASGIPEVVKHLQTGMLVRDREEDFLAAMKFLVDQPDEWKRMSNNAMALMQKEYSMERITDKWLDLFHDLKKTAQPSNPDIKFNRHALPPVHPLLTGEDVRKPALSTFFSQQGKRLLRKAHVWNSSNN